MPYLRVDDLPASTGLADRHWMLVLEDTKSLPLRDRPAKGPGCKLEDVADKAETLSGAYATYDPFSVQLFVEGVSEYNELQQVPTGVAAVGVHD